MSEPIIAPSGLLLVNKPAGPTSYDMIRWIKRITKKHKLGHCGTLDPIADGLLIILLGKATKSQSKYMGQDKIYYGRIRFGVKTDTGDSTGKPIEQTDKRLDLTLEQFQSILNKFLGSQQQMPPMYSALKFQGTPLYKLAREGKEVKREPRTITIHSIVALAVSPEEATFRVACSSGTYVRTLIEDVAQACGSLGTMTNLTREAIGDFHVKDAVSGDELKNFNEQQLWIMSF